MIAGAGTETYTVTANGATFTSGTDCDTFQVTGNQNTFLAEPTSGTDNFFDTVPSGTAPSNTLNFNDVLTSGGLVAPVRVSCWRSTTAAPRRPSTGAP